MLITAIATAKKKHQTVQSSKKKTTLSLAQLAGAVGDPLSAVESTRSTTRLRRRVSDSSPCVLSALLADR